MTGKMLNRSGEPVEVEGIWGTEPEAFVVPNQEKKIMIPPGLSPGDTFIYTPENGRSITVVVPENARSGMYLNIVVPDEVLVERSDADEPARKTTASDDSSNIKISKATAGAAIVGGLVGAVVFGPVGAVVLAGGAAYATTRKKGTIGVTARNVGTKTMSGLEKASAWVTKKVQSH